MKEDVHQEFHDKKSKKYPLSFNLPAIDFQSAGL